MGPLSTVDSTAMADAGSAAVTVDGSTTAGAGSGRVGSDLICASAPGFGREGAGAVETLGAPPLLSGVVVWL